MNGSNGRFHEEGADHVLAGTMSDLDEGVRD